MILLQFLIETTYLSETFSSQVSTYKMDITAPASQALEKIIIVNVS